MSPRVKVTVELIDPETDKTIDAVWATVPPKKTGVHPDGWPAVCTAKEAYEAAMRLVQDKRWG